MARNVFEPQHDQALCVRPTVLVLYDHGQSPVVGGGLRLIYGILYPGGAFLVTLAHYSEGRMLDVRAVSARSAGNRDTPATQMLSYAPL